MWRYLLLIAEGSLSGANPIAPMPACPGRTESCNDFSAAVARNVRIGFCQQQTGRIAAIKKQHKLGLQTGFRFERATLQWVSTLRRKDQNNFVFDKEALADALLQSNPQAEKSFIDALVQVMTDAAQGVISDMDLLTGVSLSPAVEKRGATVERRARRPARKIMLEGGGLADESELLSPEEGLRRLRIGAVAIRVEDWGGEVLGPQAAAAKIGVARSTLDNWRHAGDLVTLPKGKQRHVIPMVQFHEGRPVDGLGRVLAIAISPQVAWQWLIQPSARLDGKTPLEVLKQGGTDEVVRAAEWSLGA